MQHNLPMSFAQMPPVHVIEAQAPSTHMPPSVDAPARLDIPLTQLSVRRGTICLDREGGQLQLGTDPRWALCLDGLQAREVMWVREMCARRHLSPVALARRIGIPVDRRNQIAAAMRHGGFLTASPTAGSKHHPVERHAPGSKRHSVERPALSPANACREADEPAFDLLRCDGFGHATTAHRRMARVGISGLGRIGALTAQLLATAGVGTLVLRDDGLVHVTDIGVGGLQVGDVGHPRHLVLASRLAHTNEQVQVSEDGPVDCVVTITPHVTVPSQLHRLIAAGVPHCPVVVREASTSVGPFVVPGRTACAHCAHLHASDNDPTWPGLCDQLRQAPAPTHETMLTAATAAVTAAQILAHIDGLVPVSSNAVIDVALPHVLPLRIPLQPHRLCGCLSMTGEMMPDGRRCSALAS